MLKSLIVLFLSLSATSALADQCQILSAEEAGRALIELSKVDPENNSIYYATLCQACGETKAVTHKLISLSVTGSNADYEIVANGEAIDLAYTYAYNPTRKGAKSRAGNRKFFNLGRTVGCVGAGTPATGPSGVSAYITYNEATNTYHPAKKSD